MLAFQLREEPFYPLALQVFLRPAQIAGNDGKTHRLRKRRNVALGGVAKRTNDDVLAVIGDQFGRHGARLAGEEHCSSAGIRSGRRGGGRARSCCVPGLGGVRRLFLTHRDDVAEALIAKIG